MQPKRAFAFSLVELIIALSILGIGLIGAMRVFPVGLKASQRSEWRSRAAIIAQKTLEAAKIAEWESLAEGESSEEQKPFTVTRLIHTVQPEHVNGFAVLKRVEVSVSWNQDGKPRQLRFATYLRKHTAS